jgi:hypothetical protein
MERSGIAFGLTTVVVVLAIGWFLTGAAITKDAEEVGYVVVEELDGGIEIRRYGTLTIASTCSESSGTAFSALSLYILGNNRGNVRMDMTVPVISYREENAVNMSFILPEGYGIDNAPKPLNSDILVSELPARKLAVISFPGYAGDDAYEEHRKKLEEALMEHGVETRGDYFLLRYNPPWVPPVMMRNDVSIEVK